MLRASRSGQEVADNATSTARPSAAGPRFLFHRSENRPNQGKEHTPDHNHHDNGSEPIEKGFEGKEFTTTPVLLKFGLRHEDLRRKEIGARFNQP